MNINNHTQTSNYKILLPFLRDTYIYAQSISLSGLTLTPLEAFAGSGKKALVGGDSIEYDPVVISFVLDEKYQLWRDLIKLISSHVDPSDGTLGDWFSHDLTASIEVTDNLGKPIFRYNMTGVRIENMSSIDLSSQTDEEVVLTLSLKFDNFELEDYYDPEVMKIVTK